jgi:hypothetical protein
MGFKVHILAKLAASGLTTADYGDGDMFQFMEGGVLAITPSEDSEKLVYYSPHTWAYVDADPDHRPGTRTV